MKCLLLNGSPRKKGTVAALTHAAAQGMDGGHDVEVIDVYDFEISLCRGCMKCRETRVCVLPDDAGHELGRKIAEADVLVVGTPTHWGNMSAQLKILFDRNVPVFIGENPGGFPIPLQKGKPAGIIAACTAPWPFNRLSAESRGAVRAVKKVLKSAGYSIKGTVVKPGTHKHPELSEKLLNKARTLGARLVG